MTHISKRSILLTVTGTVLLVLLSSCSGHRIGRPAPDLASGYLSYDLKSPVKVFMKNGTIALFKEGATMTDSLIAGNATILYPSGSVRDSMATMISASEIAGATLYQFDQSAGSVLGATWSSIFGVATGILAIQCIANPKSCFGSCPTVYAPSENGSELVAELFSSSISPSLARNDLDRICTTSGDSAISIMVTNEALESHHIDMLHFVYVEHDDTTMALPRPDQSVRAYGRNTAPVTGRTSDGQSITDVLAAEDEVSWRSGPDALLKRTPQAPEDHIIIDVPTDGSDSVDLMIRWRNTLLSTILFYNMVLGDQGLNALRWQERLDKDPIYSVAFSSIYDRFSGLHVSVLNKDTWVTTEHLIDAGPIVWRTEAFRVPTFGQDTIHLRLSCLADNAIIDRVVRVKEQGGAVTETSLPLAIASTTTAVGHGAAQRLLKRDRSSLNHEPGDATVFSVDMPDAAKNGTLFIRSNGFYYEWIRQNWVMNGKQRSADHVIQSEQMIKDLARRWMDQHAMIEDSFHQSRFPLRKP